ncbi:hypothetical protein BH11MYX3_BH11MYX3_22800 [soil metagenome]
MRCRLAAAALLFAGTAQAWSHPTGDTGIEPSVVHGTLAGPVATFTARYVIPVEAAAYTETLAQIDLPSQGVVTGATVLRNGAPLPLDLLGAEDAATRFGALSADEPGPGERTSAVLISGEPGSVRIGVAAAHTGVWTIDLTVSVPSCFYRDMRYVSVPESWRKVADFSLRRPLPEADEPAGCGGSNGAWIAFPAGELTRRRSGERIGTFAGRVALGDDHVVRLEVDLAGELSDLPRDLATVILVDGSRSMSAGEREAQQQLVASYLRKAPDSRVQVISYARFAKPLLPGWTTSSQAAVRVDRELRALAQRNGSNFDVALAEAATWLERITGTRRIVLVTDERMAERLATISPVTLRRMLPAGTLVHVVAVTSGDQQPVRDEEAKLAPLAASTDGMAVRTGSAKSPELLDATLLVRPISLDRIVVKAPGWTKINPGAEQPCGDESDLLLAEGTACTWWGEGDASSGAILIEGLLWGKRTQRLLRADPTRGREVARELSAFGSLDEPLQSKANAMARAVNAHWSLYAQWGGTAKYTEGFGMGGTGGGGSCGCDSIGTIGHGHMTGAYYPPIDLAAQLWPLLAACHVEDATIQVHLEMTLTEIVDLTATILPANATSSSALRRQQTCVEDALWDAAPMLSHVEETQTFDVSLHR